MNNMITVENTEMQVREYKGQRVVTFDDVDRVHQRPKGAARKNFNRNKKHFIEKEDYYRVCASEIRTRKIAAISSKVTEDMILVTETGYLMLVKSFRDDLSWKVQRQLVNAYFRGRDGSSQTQRRTPVSSTPAPLTEKWYAKNKRKIIKLCEANNWKKREFLHILLDIVSEKYDVDEAVASYKKQTGHRPKYVIDVFDYYPEIGAYAQTVLDEMKTEFE